MLLLQLSALTVLASLAHGETCETLSFSVNKNETCKSHAILLNPSHFVQFKNGGCTLFSVCGQASKQTTTEATEDTFSIESCLRFDSKDGIYTMNRTRATTISVQRNIKWQCPSYYKLPVGKEILLLRTNAASEVSPYNLLMKSWTNSVHVSVADADANRNFTFKSPLLDAGAYRPRLKKIRVVMLSESGKELASLGFSFKSTDSVAKGRWFSRYHLISAYPWSYKKMKSLRYNYFSIRGVTDFRTTRRFYVNINFGGCGYDKGFFGVMDKVYCRYEKRTKYLPAYLFTRSGTSAGTWSRYTGVANEFRIYGVLEKGHQSIFVRRSVGC